MAVVELKSGSITNRDASPQVKNDAAVVQGIVRSVVGTLEATAADSIGSTYRMFEVPSNARMHELRIFCDDQGTAGDADVGLYRTTADGGAVVDADFFASALDVNAAALADVDILHESGVFGLEDAEKPLWEALGLTSDPNVMYDVVLTLTEASTAGGTITLRGLYAV